MSEKQLNKEQVRAITHKKGPLLIIAGAGTGKTTVVTERIKFLIEEGLAKPSEILALTFTEKAAREMQDRIDEKLPYGYVQMWINTFHSFCDRILKLEALEIGLDPSYKLMSESESIQLIRRNLFDLGLDYFRPLGNPNKFISGIIQHFSRLTDEDIEPEKYRNWAEKFSKRKNLTEEDQLEAKKWLELSRVFGKYNQIKEKEGFLDFGDLIVKTLYLFRKRKNVLSRYQKQFKYILVDEYQDTNYAQNELAIILAGEKRNITVCGDDNQSIYRFRGAAVSNILQFKERFPEVKTVTLTSNYRSTQKILDSAYRLIKHNDPDTLEARLGISKKLVSVGKNKGEDIVFLHTDRVENEAEEVSKRVEELTKGKNPKYDYSDIAILVRANNHSEPFGRALSRKGIPHQFLGPGRLFKQSEIVDLISYLKVLDNCEDNVAFLRLLSIDIFDISGRDIMIITNYAKRKNLSLFETCEKTEDVYVSQKTKDTIGNIVDMIKKHIDLTKKETAGQIMYYFLTDSGLMQSLVNPDGVEAQKVAVNISKFFDKLKSYETGHEDSSVRAIVDWIDLASELGESPLAAETDWTEINAVNILTVHSAKGLEFPVVFLVNLVSNRFPTIQRKDQIPIHEELIKEELPEGDYHLEEERRLFYVGMTRAKDRLFLTASDYYAEAKRQMKLSLFIHESLGEDVALKDLLKNANQLSFLEFGTRQDKPVFEERVFKIDYLSYSQIETFKTCPLHYKLKYILKVPTPQTAAQSFGTSVHGALKDFYRDINKKQSKDYLIRLLDKNWIKEGYLSKKHEKEYFNKGREYLSGYYESKFDPKVKTVFTEEMFAIPLYQKGLRPLKIGGRIDRVDIVNNGSGIEIIDYKTGANIPTQKEIDKDLQMTFYALAATKIKEYPFDRKPEDVKLTFYYFDNQKEISTSRTREDLNLAINEIFKTRDNIEKSDFKCSGNYFCRNCEYKLLCDVSR